MQSVWVFFSFHFVFKLWLQHAKNDEMTKYKQHVTRWWLKFQVRGSRYESTHRVVYSSLHDPMDTACWPTTLMQRVRYICITLMPRVGYDVATRHRREGSLFYRITSIILWKVSAVMYTYISSSSSVNLCEVLRSGTIHAWMYKMY